MLHYFKIPKFILSYKLELKLKIKGKLYFFKDTILLTDLKKEKTSHET